MVEQIIYIYILYTYNVLIYNIYIYIYFIQYIKRNLSTTVTLHPTYFSTYLLRTKPFSDSTTVLVCAAFI